MTAQFVIEDHALRHSWHHLAKIRAAFSGKAVTVAEGASLKKGHACRLGAPKLAGRSLELISNDRPRRMSQRRQRCTGLGL